MTKVVKNDLGYLGIDFQYRLIGSFINEPNFFKDLESIIDQNMFTDQYLRVIVGVMKEYFAKHDSVPSFGMIAIKLKERALTEEDDQYFQETLEKIKNTTTEGIEEIQEMAEKFFKQQNWVRVANEIIKIAKDGNAERYDEIDSLTEKAASIGRKDADTSSPLENVDGDLSKEDVVIIPTGIKQLDEALGGGVEKGKLGLIIGSSGFGKSQPLDARILTPNGYKLMGDMKIGDQVIGRDGKAHDVIGVFPQGMRPIYKLTFSNGTTCECDEEHLWSVSSTKDRAKNEYHVKTLKDILKEGLKINSGDKRRNFKIPKAEIVNFNEQKLNIDPYLVGYYFGAGCFSRVGLSVGAFDNERIKEELLPILKEDLHIFYREKRNIFCYDIIGKSKENLRKEFGYSNSYNKEIPMIYLFNTVENRIALLQGLMDSDGYANKNGSCEFCSKSRRLAEQVQFLVRSLGGYASMTVATSSYFNKKKNERIICKDRYRVTISFCDESIKPFRLQRKQERVKYRKKYKENIFIESAEYVGEKAAQCIMVNSDEHLYLTEDFIVTHNTSMTTGFAAYAATQGFRVLQIVFEDTQRDIHRKYMSYISEVESKDLNKDTETTDYVRQSLKNSPMSELINNNIRTIRLESGEKTATDIKNIIKKKINEGFKPDMVIIDYFECVAHERGTSTDKEEVKEGKTMRKFENMAAEFDALFWITTQGNRDSFGAEIITQDKVGGSIKKTQIAHVILSIARNLDDMASQKANITILKNRGNMAGKTFNGCHFNNGTCRITCDDVVDLVSVLAYNENAKDVIENKMDYYKQKIREQKAAKQANAEKEFANNDFQ